MKESKFKTMEKFAGLKVEAPFIVRVDGWRFHGFTRERNFKKPFDQALSDLMTSTTTSLFIPFRPHFVMTHSDEASFLFTDTKMFDRVEKLDSLLASSFAATFSIKAGALAPFDARVIPLTSRMDAIDYFVWRQQDSKRNFAYGWADLTLQTDEGLSPRVSAKRLTGMNEEEQQRLCYDHNVNLDLLPAWQQFGLSARWEKYVKNGYNPITKTDVVAERRRVVLAPCDDFDTSVGKSALQAAIL